MATYYTMRRFNNVPYLITAAAFKPVFESKKFHLVFCVSILKAHHTKIVICGGESGSQLHELLLCQGEVEPVSRG